MSTQKILETEMLRHMKNCEDSIQAIQAKEWCKGRSGGQRMPAKDSCKQPITDRSTEGN